MATLTLTSAGLAAVPTVSQTVNIKIRKTSDPDIASSYTNVGNFIVLPNGNFSAPVVISDLLNATSYTVWVTNPCSNSSFTQDFDVALYGNILASQVFTRNNCASGYAGTSVNYVVAANTYFATTQDAANALAQADITANGQNYANTHGSCLLITQQSTLIVDFYNDLTADLCMYCSTAGTAEQNQIVASTVNGGPLQLPNDGTNPAQCYLLSSDNLNPGPPVHRFGVNIAYFIDTYPDIDHFTFVMRGRSATAGSVTGLYNLRTIAQGYLTMGGSPGQKIPGVSEDSMTGDINYSSNIVSGANGSVGASVGSPVLQLDYVVSTNTMTATTF